MVTKFIPEVLYVGKSTEGDNNVFVVSLPISVEMCRTCSRPMLREGHWLFSDIPGLTQDEVVSQVGIVPTDVNFMDGSEGLCQECAGKLIFQCGICEKNKTIHDIKVSHNRKHYCYECYKTVSAARWDSVVFNVNDEDEEVEK